MQLERARLQLGGRIGNALCSRPRIASFRADCAHWSVLLRRVETEDEQAVPLTCAQSGEGATRNLTRNEGGTGLATRALFSADGATVHNHLHVLFSRMPSARNRPALTF